MEHIKVLYLEHLEIGFILEFIFKIFKINKYKIKLIKLIQKIK